MINIIGKSGSAFVHTQNNASSESNNHILELYIITLALNHEV